MHSLFEIQHLSYAYHTMQGETAALSDITFTVNTGDFVAIVGPSGCGKSTLLNLLAGMLTPESGTLLLNGTPLTADSRCHIGYMLQQDYLLEWRSIWKNVLLGLEIRHEVTEESCSYAKQNGTRERISGICLVGCDYVSALFPISFKAAVLHKASVKSDSLSCAYQFFQGPWAAHCLICMADRMAVSACATHCKNA